MQRLHREEGLKRLVTAGGGEGSAPIEAAGAAMSATPTDIGGLRDALAAAEAAKARLDALLKG